MRRRRPVGETRRDRFNQWVIGLGVVLVLSCVISSTALLLQHNRDLRAIGTAVQTTKTDTVEVKALEKQVATVIDGLPAAGAQISAFAKQILAVEQFAVTCLTTQNCSNPPAISTSP